MPRDKTARRSVKPNAIVASAARVVAGRRKNLPSGAGAIWQNEAWEKLDTVGELESYRGWVSNSLSRCELEVVEETPDGDVPVTDPALLAPMDELFGGNEGQSDMLAMMGGHIGIVGETWLVGLLEPPDDPELDMWRVLSRDEVKPQGNRWQIDRGDGEPEVYGSEDVYITRLWRPHPRKWVEANSSVRSALPILRALEGIARREAANNDSRLIGNGILAVPSEITFASPSEPNDDGTDLLGDPFMAALVEAGTTAIEDPGSPEALFPILVRGTAEHIDKIKHLTLASDMDKYASERESRLLNRLANSLDVPAEVLTGMGDINHWGQWFTDETGIKIHVTPVLNVIATGITTRYYWPALQGDAERLDPDLRRFKVIGTTKNLSQRPNRAADANTGRAALIITDKAWARETGFADTDLLSHPDNAAELQHRLLVSAAGGVQTADVTVAALAAAGVPLTPKPSEVDAGTDAPVGPQAVPAAPAPPALEQRNPPAQAAALLAASEVIVRRAIEVAWFRAGSKGRGPSSGRERPPIDNGRIDACLIGAWTDLTDTASLLGVDPMRFRNAVDAYTRALLETGSTYERRDLAGVLVRDVLTPPMTELG